MSDTLFTMLTTHCFFGCGHTTIEATTTGSSDAMERHYWEVHYSPQERAKLREAGQVPERIGVTAQPVLTCRSCAAPLVEGPAKDQSKEQAWCGTWYDHPPVSLGACAASMTTLLVMSDALRAQHDAMKTEAEK